MYKIMIVEKATNNIMVSLIINQVIELEIKLNELMNLYYDELKDEQYILVLQHITD